MKKVLGVEYVVKGKVLIEKYKNNDSIRLCTENFIGGNIKLDITDINANKYYSVYKDSGDVEIYEVGYIDTIVEFNKFG